MWIIILIAIAVIIVFYMIRRKKVKKPLTSGKKHNVLIDYIHQKIKQGGIGYCRRLADLYYFGSEIGGIPSNPIKAIKWYTRAVEADGDIESLVYIGDIYRNGVALRGEIFEIEPDVGYAKKCYQKAIEYSTGPLSAGAKGESVRVFNLARERLNELGPTTQAQRVGLPETFSTFAIFHDGNSSGLDRSTVPRKVDLFSDGRVSSLFNSPPVKVVVEDRNLDPEILLRPPPVERADFRHPLPREVPIPSIINTGPANRARDIRPPEEGIRNDPQNAHDTTLLRGARETINKLRESTPITIDTSTTLTQLRKHLLSINDISRRDKAIAVLDKIETNHTPLTNMHEMNEVDILNLVYNRMHSDVNKGRENDLVEVLVDQLCDGHGAVGPVCATGRATRILSSLDATDAQADEIITLKPKWAIKQELLNNASVIRDKLIKERGLEFETMYSKPDYTPDEKKVAESFDNNFKQTLKDQFKREYVDSGILTQNDLNEELEKWIDHV